MIARLLERATPEEIGLVKLHHPRQARAVRVGERVGVLADDDVLLFETQDALRLEAEGLDAEFPACFDDRVPHMGPVRARHVDLVAQLSDEPDSQNQDGHAR